jgi:hypothetical protein
MVSILLSTCGHICLDGIYSWEPSPESDGNGGGGDGEGSKSDSGFFSRLYRLAARCPSTMSSDSSLFGARDVL